MKYSAEFIELLPSLRRFSRALTGNQNDGDELVIKTLEQLSRGRMTDSSESPRKILFQQLALLWNGPLGQLLQVRSHESESLRSVDRNLAKLTPFIRQVFLLVAMEGFSVTEAGTILGKTVTEISAALQRAREEIAAQVKSKVFIIAEEQLLAAKLESLMNDLGHDVIAIERTRESAVTEVKQNHPGIILADVRLSDGSSGIDAVNDILADIEVPVVFITANPGRILTVPKPEPTYLITKPLKEDQVRAVVSQALFLGDVAHRIP